VKAALEAVVGLDIRILYADELYDIAVAVVDALFPADALVDTAKVE
jgi:hypothetical protein